MLFFPPLLLPQLKFWNWGLSAMAGSANVRIGHASSKAPITVPHCIAHHLWINDKKEGSAKRSSHKGAVGEKWVCALPNMITYDYLTEYLLFDSDICSMLRNWHKALSSLYCSLGLHRYQQQDVMNAKTFLRWQDNTYIQSLNFSGENLGCNIRLFWLLEKCPVLLRM